LTTKFLAFALLGSQWVLWLLIGLSVVSVAIMIERLLYFARRKVDLDALVRDARAGVHDPEATLQKWKNVEAMEAVIARTGLAEAHRGPGAAPEAMVGGRSRARPLLERPPACPGTPRHHAPLTAPF